MCSLIGQRLFTLLFDGICSPSDLAHSPLFHNAGKSPNYLKTMSFGMKRQRFGFSFVAFTVQVERFEITVSASSRLNLSIFPPLHLLLMTNSKWSVELNCSLSFSLRKSHSVPLRSYWEFVVVWTSISLCWNLLWVCDFGGFLFFREIVLALGGKTLILIWGLSLFMGLKCFDWFGGLGLFDCFFSLMGLKSF